MSEAGNKVIVVGGGAAGLMAAYRAAANGAETIVLEKMDAPARKVLVSGKGRCNVTTGHELKKTIELFGRNGKFLYSSFSNFYAPELIDFLAERGVELKLERGKRYFPTSDRSADIANALKNSAREAGAEIKTGKRVEKIETADGAVTGVLVRDHTRENAEAALMEADRVILATGGMSYPSTGSSGDGYRLAADLGHEIIPPRPALIPIELRGKIHGELSPLSLRNVRVSLDCDGKIICEKFGEMMFTPFGATGPVILDIGKMVSEHHGSPMKLIINYKPYGTPEEFDARFRSELEAAGGKLLKSVVSKMLPGRAVPVFLGLARIPENRKVSEVSRDERMKLQKLFTGMEFDIKGTRPIEEAIVTAGGVSIKSIDPRTMESKLVKGLYVCGELLDVDGPTGGFNLQAAFSTGYAAGEAAAG